MNPHENLHDEIREMFALVKVAEGWRRPSSVLLSMRQYRGKRQYVAGYCHSRKYAHHLGGIVYERILGWGETPEAAVNKMRDRLTTQAAKKG